MKYKIEDALPILSKGGSTGLAPIQVRIKKAPKYVEVFILLKGENLLIGGFDDLRTREYRIKMLMSRANTPPSLLGMERKIA